MKRNKFFSVLLALGLASVSAVGSDTIAQNSLSIGGSSANFGVHALHGGFVPDPHQVPNIVSGGSLNVAQMGLGAGCRGFATGQPDVIVNYSNAASFLRFYFQGQGDTALVINTADGRWLCNDDTAGLNPQIDIQNPGNGQYDIWVTSYRAGENIRGALFATELQSNRARP